MNVNNDKKLSPSADRLTPIPFMPVMRHIRVTLIL